MNLQMACLIAAVQGKGIRRTDKLWGELVVIPTNTEDCCLLLRTSKNPARGWEPRLADLIANDWEVTE